MRLQPPPGAAPDALLGARRRLLLAGAGTVALGACGRAPDGVRQLEGASMASTYRLKLARASAADAGAAQQAVAAALDAVEARMSLFRADSELARLNRHGADRPLALSPELHAVLAAAREVAALSRGAFDVTVAPLVQAWGFGTDRRRALPPAARIDAGRAAVGWQALHLDAGALAARKERAGLQADLGAIAKGYGVDRAAAALDALGFGDYLLELGGEVRTRGRNGDGRDWRIGIEQPDAEPPRLRWVLPLAGGAVATSGDYRNYFMHDARRYSHAIDPQRGAPIVHALCSVTVVAGDCMRADALATALLVLGAGQAQALAAAAGIAALLIERGADGGYRDTMSPAFAALGAQRA